MLTIAHFQTENNSYPGQNGGFARPKNLPEKTLVKRRKIGYTTDILEIWRYYPMAQITKDTIIGDILDIAPETAPLFLSIGMHCLGCPSSRGETVEEACMVHGVDVDELLAKINASVKA